MNNLLNNDIVISRSWGVSRGRIVSAHSRAQQWTSYTLEVMHLPTGLKVAGQVEPGCYTRSEITTKRAALASRLQQELQLKLGDFPSQLFRIEYGRMLGVYRGGRSAGAVPLERS